MDVRLVEMTIEYARSLQADPMSRDTNWPADYPERGDIVGASIFLNALDAGLDPRPFGNFQIVVDSVIVGSCGFHGPPTDGVAEIGYNVVTSYRNRGVASAAVKLLIDVTRHLGVRRVIATTDPNNVASERVLLHNGLNPVDRVGDLNCFALDLEGP